jgi:hypothetical protein
MHLSGRCGEREKSVRIRGTGRSWNEWVLDMTRTLVTEPSGYGIIIASGIWRSTARLLGQMSFSLGTNNRRRRLLTWARDQNGSFAYSLGIEYRLLWPSTFAEKHPYVAAGVENAENGRNPSASSPSSRPSRSCGTCTHTRPRSRSGLQAHVLLGKTALSSESFTRALPSPAPKAKCRERSEMSVTS